LRGEELQGRPTSDSTRRKLEEKTRNQDRRRRWGGKTVVIAENTERGCATAERLERERHESHLQKDEQRERSTWKTKSKITEKNGWCVTRGKKNTKKSFGDYKWGLGVPGGGVWF